MGVDASGDSGRPGDTGYRQPSDSDVDTGGNAGVEQWDMVTDPAQIRAIIEGDYEAANSPSPEDRKAAADAAAAGFRARTDEAADRIRAGNSWEPGADVE